jgi:hypothetical protein
MSDIIIPIIILNDCPMSELSDLFTIDIISNSFPLLTKNKVSKKNKPFDYLELSLNKRYCNGVVVDERTLYSTTNNSVSSWDTVVQCV